MKIPKTIKVGAYDYKIVRHHNETERTKDFWGYCDREKHVIYLEEDMDGKKEKEVLLHECLHAIEESYGITLGETKVNLLGLALMALITDNKLRFV